MQPLVGLHRFISCDGGSGCASGATAPDFSTSFTSATTGHAFSSGRVGEEQFTRSKRRLASRMGLKRLILYGNRPAPQA